jgi:hypothetical protein
MTSEVATRASSIHVVHCPSTALVLTATQFAMFAACALLAARQTSSLLVWPAALAELPLVC